MRKLWHYLTSDERERGAVMFLVAGTTVLVLLLGAVAVDVSITATQGQQLQNAADAAALAGVQAYPRVDGLTTSLETQPMRQPLGQRSMRSWRRTALLA